MRYNEHSNLRSLRICHGSVWRLERPATLQLWRTGWKAFDMLPSHRSALRTMSDATWLTFTPAFMQLAPAWKWGPAQAGRWNRRACGAIHLNWGSSKNPRVRLTPNMATGLDELEKQRERWSLEGRIAVVTGGHRGIGKAISIGLGAAGADVIIIDRQGAKDSDMEALISSMGRKYASIRADMSDDSSILHAAREAERVAEEWGGGVSVLVNNAGVALLDSLEKLTVSAWDTSFAVNVRGTFILTRELVTGQKGMLSYGKGSVVNISSAAGSRALRSHAAYCSSKAAVEMLTRGMTEEWAGRGIRCNAVAPTVVLTDMGREIWEGTAEGDEMIRRVPAGRFALPHEIADVVVFLCTDGASMINGAVIPVDGGFSAT